MRIHGLISWFDEPVKDLIACITALAESGVEHVVAVDGRYEWFPADEPHSDISQSAAVVTACRALGVACTLHVPTVPWEGEPEKRTFMFRVAWACADDGDWFWVQDADQVVTRCPDTLREQLAGSECQVAKVEICDVMALRANQKDWPPYFEMCALFRAQPITVGPHHAVYTGPDGQALWVGNGIDTTVPTLDLTGVVRVEHRPDRRSNARQVAKAAGYAARDHARVERGTCERCGEPSVTLATVNWRWTEIGPVGDWAEACEPCSRVLDSLGRRQLRRLGIDPSSVVPENRNGKPPETVSRREAIQR